MRDTMREGPKPECPRNQHGCRNEFQEAWRRWRFRADLILAWRAAFHRYGYCRRRAASGLSSSRRLADYRHVRSNPSSECERRGLPKRIAIHREANRVLRAEFRFRRWLPDRRGRVCPRLRRVRAAQDQRAKLPTNEPAIWLGAIERKFPPLLREPR